MHCQRQSSGYWGMVMNSVSCRLTSAIKAEALRLGFSACGVAQAGVVDSDTRQRLRRWLDDGSHACMGYMANHFEKRCNLSLLVEDAKSVIVVALNYFPRVMQPSSHPQFATYAYGMDYHQVMREKLTALFDFISSQTLHSGRIFCDTAPLLERYWARQAGIGFIGKNTQLITPSMGSYVFLGEIVTSLELQPDSPSASRCGKCTRCLDNCPTNALTDPYRLDANRCISCQTIENRDEIPLEIKSQMGNRVYGCDTCQWVCPWNRFSTPTSVLEFLPSSEFLRLDFDRLSSLTPDQFRDIFRYSAVKRTKYEGLMRNAKALSDPKKK